MNLPFAGCVAVRLEGRHSHLRAAAAEWRAEQLRHEFGHEAAQEVDRYLHGMADPPPERLRFVTHDPLSDTTAIVIDATMLACPRCHLAPRRAVGHRCLG